MEHVFPTYAQYPMEIVSGHDWHLVDSHHKSYLDFTSGIGVCSFGYSNDWIEQSVINQLGKVWHTSNLYPSSLQDEVAASLCPAGISVTRVLKPMRPHLNWPARQLVKAKFSRLTMAFTAELTGRCP